MRRAPILVIALTLIAAMSFTGCKGPQKAAADEQKQEAKGTPVSVLTIQARDLQETVKVTGTLQPADEVTVGPRFAGEVAWVIGKAGTRVKQGQIVARLDDADARIQLRTAKAALQAARARLEQAKAGYVQQRTATDSGILNAQAALAAAEARYQQARTSYEAMAATTNAQIKQAEQGVNAANSRLQALKNGSRSQEKLIAENSVRLAAATRDNDQANFDRLNSLFGQGAVSKSQLDAAETKLKVSQMQYESAVQQASLVQEGARQEDIDAANAALAQAQAALDSTRAGQKQVDVAQDNVEIARTGVEQAKAALQSAKSSVNIDTMRDKDVLAAQAAVQQAEETVAAAEQTLDYTNIYSPVDGVVAEKLAEQGESLGSNAPVLRITTTSALYFEAQVPELEATRLHAGQTVMLSIDALQGNRTNMYRKQQSNAIAATVERVVPVVNARTRNFTVRVVVADTPELYPGMFARGEVIVAEHDRVIAVPKDAVVEKQDRQLLYVVANGTAHERTVMLGATDGEYIQVISGVLNGEQLVVVGQQSLLDGDRVTITKGSASEN